MITVPPSPVPVSLVNQVMRGLNKIGIARTTLNADELIVGAQKRANLIDFGPGPYKENLQQLTDALNSEAKLSPVGRLLTREALISSLSNQLKLQDWFRRYPEIAEQEIQSPIIIIGMPRSGTTILHEVMALDDNSRIPLFWEADNPFPPPETNTYLTDPRIKRAEQLLKISHYLMPGVENLHRMGARLPQECVKLTADMFASMLYITIYHIPSYAKWLAEEADMPRSYQYHRRMLQLLQWRCPAKRWVIKSPGHLWTLEALLKEYPDAKLIQTHRDPLKVVSSLASMMPVLRSAFSRDIDPQRVAAEWSECCAIALNASLETRKSGLIKPDQIIDIQFREFMGAEEKAVKEIYAAFDLEFTDELEGRIRRYVSGNPHDKHGGHKHSFENTGLDYQVERAKVKAYQNYFNVETEF
ncbi:MAG: sulfotransferase [Halieaceae bacterium]|nr:sulfotransferase [Halieaceae bacterium]